MLQSLMAPTRGCPRVFTWSRQRIGRGAEFVKHLDVMRANYKIKRNFIKLLEKNRKSLCLSDL